MNGEWDERIDPEVAPRGVVSHHLKKYEFAKLFARGLVADIACGVGYGTGYLASEANLVVGIEIDAKAVDLAGVRYARRGAVFIQADGTAIPFKAGMVDCLICFEGIEHFQDAAAHVREAARVLSADGVYLVSTPRVGARGGSHDHGAGNPFHVHEFTAIELESLLSNHFMEVRMFGQRRLQTFGHRVLQRLDVFALRRRSWFRPAAKRVSLAVGTAPLDDAGLNDFVIDTLVEEALDLVAVCTRPIAATEGRE